MRLGTGFLLWALALGSAVQAGSFDAYTRIQKALISQQVSAEEVAAASELFPGQPDFIGAMEVLPAIAGEPVLSQTGPYSAAYFQFIALPGQPDILYDFLVRETEPLMLASQGGTLAADALSWGWANVAKSSIKAFERTGERRFLDLYLTTVPVVFSNLDSERGLNDPEKIGADGWSLSDNGILKRDVTTVGRITSPMFEMALAAKRLDGLSAADLTAISEYADRATAILKPYLTAQVVDGARRYYVFPWTGEEEAINHMAAFAEACAFAYALTGNVEFKTFVEGFLEYFRSVVTVGEDGTYSWPYQVRSEGQHEEFFWKGAVTVPALINVHASGIPLWDEDIRGIANSFDNYVLGEFYSVNAYMGLQDFRVTGYNGFRLEYAQGLLFQQFVLLEEWRPGTKTKVLEAVASRPDLFPTGFFLHSSDAVPYAYMLPQQ